MEKGGEINFRREGGHRRNEGIINGTKKKEREAPLSYKEERMQEEIRIQGTMERNTESWNYPWRKKGGN